jgi:hypothetical protein
MFLGPSDIHARDIAIIHLKFWDTNQQHLAQWAADTSVSPHLPCSVGCMQVSAVIRGNPSVVLRALLDPGSATTILGPALEVEVLESTPGRQVRHPSFRSSSTAQQIVDVVVKVQQRPACVASAGHAGGAGDSNW